MNWQVKWDTSKLPADLIFPPGKNKWEQQTHTSCLGGYNELPLPLLPNEKNEYWPQLLPSVEAGRVLQPKALMDSNRMAVQKKKMATGCYQTSLAVSVDFSLTVIVSQSI